MFAQLAIALSSKKKDDPDLLKLREQLKEQLPKNVSEAQLKAWIPRAIESLSHRNIEEEKRMTNRDGKTWRHTPPNYALLESNMQDRDLDIAERIISEIQIHGRQTQDELVDHLGGIDRPMVVMVYLAMLNDNYLKWYEEEEDKIKTLELVEISPEEQLAQQKQKELEDKTAKKKKKKKGKKSILDKIKIVENYVEPQVESYQDVLNRNKQKDNPNRMRQIFDQK